MEIAKILGLIVLGYILGGIPTGYLVARKMRGIDIRKHGSGNPGTANVYRIAGPIPGIITLIVDAFKGYLPVLIAQKVCPGQHIVMMLCGAAAIIGHDWTIFLKFKGGKGVATTAGVFLAMMPKSVGCAMLVFIAGYGFSGHISVGSMVSSAMLPVFNILFGVPVPYTVMAAGAAGLILYKHVPNLKRLYSGKELTLFDHEKK